MPTSTYPALHACLYCGRHPSTHAPATPDSVDACPACGLCDALEDQPSPEACPRCQGVGVVRDGGVGLPCPVCRPGVLAAAIAARLRSGGT